MVFRFLHLADLHLETAFGGREETRARLAKATQEAWARAIDFAIEERLDAVLIAGDAFDNHKLSLAGEASLLAQLGRLREAGIHALYVTGNHDPGGSQGRAARMGLQDPTDTIEARSGAFIFRRSAPKAVTLYNAESEPIAIVVGAGHSQDKVDTNLAAKFKRIKTELPVVGLLHTQVTSARLAEAHAPYAPSTREDYAAVEYDYWALGHVHVRQQVFPDLPVWYAGNLQGRNPKETGAKGGLLVEVQKGQTPEVDFVSLAPVQWTTVTADDLNPAENVDSLFSILETHATAASKRENCDVQDLCIRFELAGPSPLARRLRDALEREQLELEFAAHSGLLEAQFRTRQLRSPRDLQPIETTPSVPRRALEILRQVQDDDALLEQLAPGILAGWFEENGQTKAEYLRARIEGLEEELLDRCFSEEAWT